MKRPAKSKTTQALFKGALLGCTALTGIALAYTVE